MEEIDAELAAMCADEDMANMEAIPDAGVGYVKPIAAPAAPVADALDAAMEEEEAPARQLVGAWIQILNQLLNLYFFIINKTYFL